MAKITCCYNCVFAYLDPEITLKCYEARILNYPACANHPDSYGRMRRTPERGICPNYRPKPEKPEGDVGQIPLDDGFYAYVDAADCERLSRYNWRLQNGYAARREKGRTIYMHREIARPPRGMTVDHKNRNRLDNTRDNLRVCTQQENSHNNGKHKGSSSRFKGVGYNREKRKWFAKAYIDGQRIWLGYHDEETVAAKAYDAKAVELFGEFAHLNFPQDWPPERREEVYATRHAEAVKRKTRNARRKTKQPRAKTQRRKPSKRGKRQAGSKTMTAKRSKGR